MKDAIILDIDKPLSQAIERILADGTAAIITKEEKYYGIIDDRHLSTGIADPSLTKCGSVSVRAPHLYEDSTLEEKINIFLAGHFRSIPVISKDEKPTGLITRTDILGEIFDARLIPKIGVTEIMNSPVYSIEYNQTIGAAKTWMKEKKAKRLLVTKNGYPYGVISTLDLVSETLNPRGRNRKEPIKEVKNRDSGIISERIEDVVVSVEKDTSLEVAAKKLIERKVSSLVVLENKKPVGVVSATDIFKILRDNMEDKVEIIISGLDEEQLHYYSTIKDKLEQTIKKYRKSFEIGQIHLHLKKGKTVYEAKLKMNVDGKPLAISSQDHSFHDTIMRLVDELHAILNKKR